ncbi:hypothetical protein ACLB1S_20585 [Escherichia coli]
MPDGKWYWQPLYDHIRQLGLTLPVSVTANALAEEKQRCLESGQWTAACRSR